MDSIPLPAFSASFHVFHAILRNFFLVWKCGKSGGKTGIPEGNGRKQFLSTPSSIYSTGMLHYFLLLPYRLVDTGTKVRFMFGLYYYYQVGILSSLPTLEAGELAYVLLVNILTSAGIIYYSIHDFVVWVSY